MSDWLQRPRGPYGVIVRADYTACNYCLSRSLVASSIVAVDVASSYRHCFRQYVDLKLASPGLHSCSFKRGLFELTTVAGIAAMIHPARHTSSPRFQISSGNTSPCMSSTTRSVLRLQCGTSQLQSKLKRGHDDDVADCSLSAFSLQSLEPAISIRASSNGLSCACARSFDASVTAEKQSQEAWRCQQRIRRWYWPEEGSKTRATGPSSKWYRNGTVE